MTGGNQTPQRQKSVDKIAKQLLENKFVYNSPVDQTNLAFERKASEKYNPKNIIWKQI